MADTLDKNFNFGEKKEKGKLSKDFGKLSGENRPNIFQIFLDSSE